MACHATPGNFAGQRKEWSGKLTYDPHQGQYPPRPPYQGQWPPQQQQPQYPPQYQQPQPQPQQWPQPGPGHRQPPRKRRKGGIAAFVIGGSVAVIIVIAIAAANSGGKAPASSPGTPAAGASSPAAPAKAAAATTVTYVVTGSSADVTYGPAGSSLSGHAGMSKTTAIPAHAPAYYSIDAQLSGSGSVTCEILVSGKVISKSTASGAYNIASCEITQDPFSGQWSDTNAA